MGRGGWEAFFSLWGGGLLRVFLLGREMVEEGRDEMGTGYAVGQIIVCVCLVGRFLHA